MYLEFEEVKKLVQFLERIDRKNNGLPFQIQAIAEKLYEELSEVGTIEED